MLKPEHWFELILGALGPAGWSWPSGNVKSRRARTVEIAALIGVKCTSSGNHLDREAAARSQFVRQRGCSSVCACLLERVSMGLGASLFAGVGDVVPTIDGTVSATDACRQQVSIESRDVVFTVSDVGVLIERDSD